MNPLKPHGNYAYHLLQC